MRSWDFRVDWAYDQKVSSYLALILVALLSLMVAWYSLDAADEIIKLAPNSTTFNVQKRLEKYDMESGQGSAPAGNKIDINAKVNSNRTQPK